MSIEELLSQLRYNAPSILAWGFQSTIGGMRVFMEQPEAERQPYFLKQ